MNRLFIAVVLLCCAVVAVSSSPVVAGEEATCFEGTPHTFLRMTTADTPWDGCTVVVPGGYALVEVWADPTDPITQIRFSLQNPPFGTVTGETYDFPYTGSLSTGVEIDLGDCSAGTAFRLMTFLLLVTDPGGTIQGCVTWGIDPSPDVTDCHGAVRPATVRHQDFSAAAGCCYYIDCPSLPPYDPFPADGATGVPLDVELTWVGSAPWFYYVDFGTDCGSLTEYDVSGPPFSPGPLEPATTYYWYASWTDGLECGAASPVFSFTTEIAVGTEPTTWSRIKNLYRR